MSRLRCDMLLCFACNFRSVLSSYVRIITTQDFLAHVAPQWPAKHRSVLQRAMPW